MKALGRALKPPAAHSDFELSVGGSRLACNRSMIGNYPGCGQESPSPGGARSQGKGRKVNTGLREGSVYRVSP